MKVFIDSREQDKIQKTIHYWELNKNKFPHIDKIEVRTNAASDICTSDGYVGVERKSAADFMASVCGGKLKQQLFELKQNFENAILFVEDYDGIMDCIEKNPKIHPNVIIGATASTFAHSKVPICYVGAFYIPIVLTTIEKFLDGKQYTDKEYTPLRRAVTKGEYKLNIIKGLPGIGATNAESLLSHFNNSIKNMVNASIEQYMEIDGIGKIKAQQIKEVLE